MSAPDKAHSPKRKVNAFRGAVSDFKEKRYDKKFEKSYGKMSVCEDCGQFGHKSAEDHASY